MVAKLSIWFEKEFINLLFYGKGITTDFLNKYYCLNGPGI
jgi:hypothetical protein